MKVGLTLGKFAPFHKGHQFLIETALSEVDKLVVVIYACDELPQCPLFMRANWIKSLYPQVEIVLASDGPKETGYSPEIMAKHDRYLQNLLKTHSIDYFFSSEPYGEHVSKALNCHNVQVDPARNHVAVSATAIRQNIDRCQEFLSELVFNDLMANTASK